MEKEARTELEYWLRLSTLEGVGCQTKLELITLLDGAQNVYMAGENELLRAGVTLQQYQEYHSGQSKRQADTILEVCRKEKIRIIPISDDEYPEMLKFIQDPPLVLFVRGNIPKLNAIAIVGSRRASGYGIETAVKMASELSYYGFTVVSGMARGIDTAAHCGALNSEGKTVAVLGCGVDIPYPPENKSLMERIANSGAVISEYPPGTVPATFHFPSRNRIISGMSLGTIVVEAGLKSGSLITANYALEQGREVFAIPGNITSRNSMGTNRLIKDGAKIVLGVDDILDELNFGITPIGRKTRKKAGHGEKLDKKGQRIVNALKIEDLYDEELSLKTSIPLNELFEILLDLELKGLVKKSLTGKYMLLA